MRIEYLVNGLIALGLLAYLGYALLRLAPDLPCCSPIDEERKGR